MAAAPVVLSLLSGAGWAEAAVAVQTVSGSLDNLAAGAEGAARGISNLTRQMLAHGGELQRLQLSYTVFLGSVDKANKLLQEVREFAIKTPFEFRELQIATKNMLAFGFSAKEIIPTLEKIGDLAAATGADLLSVTNAFNQMKVGQVGIGMSMMRFYGVPTHQIGAKLKENYGYAGMPQQAPPSMAIEATKDVIAQRFPNLMERLMPTYEAALSNLTDATNELYRTIGTFLIPEVTTLVRSIEAAASNAKEFLAGENNELGQLLASLGTNIIAISAGIQAANVVGGSFGLPRFMTAPYGALMGLETKENLSVAGRESSMEDVAAKSQLELQLQQALWNTEGSISDNSMAIEKLTKEIEELEKAIIQRKGDEALVAALEAPGSPYIVAPREQSEEIGRRRAEDQMRQDQQRRVAELRAEQEGRALPPEEGGGRGWITATSALGGAAAGAGVGALIGSALPVIGTAVGAVVGGIIGGVGYPLAATTMIERGERGEAEEEALRNAPPEDLRAEAIRYSTEMADRDVTGNLQKDAATQQTVAETYEYIDKRLGGEYPGLAEDLKKDQAEMSRYIAKKSMEKALGGSFEGGEFIPSTIGAQRVGGYAKAEELFGGGAMGMGMFEPGEFAVGTEYAKRQSLLEGFEAMEANVPPNMDPALHKELVARMAAEAGLGQELAQAQADRLMKTKLTVDQLANQRDVQLELTGNYAEAGRLQDKVIEAKKEEAKAKILEAFSGSANLDIMSDALKTQKELTQEIRKGLDIRYKELEVARSLAEVTLEEQFVGRAGGTIGALAGRSAVLDSNLAYALEKQKTVAEKAAMGMATPEEEVAARKAVLQITKERWDLMRQIFEAERKILELGIAQEAIARRGIVAEHRVRAAMQRGVSASPIAALTARTGEAGAQGMELFVQRQELSQRRDMIARQLAQYSESDPENLEKRLELQNQLAETNNQLTSLYVQEWNLAREYMEISRERVNLSRKLLDMGIAVRESEAKIWRTGQTLAAETAVGVKGGPVEEIASAGITAAAEVQMAAFQESQAWEKRAAIQAQLVWYQENDADNIEKIHELTVEANEADTNVLSLMAQQVRASRKAFEVERERVDLSRQLMDMAIARRDAEVSVWEAQKNVLMEQIRGKGGGTKALLAEQQGAQVALQMAMFQESQALQKRVAVQEQLAWYQANDSKNINKIQELTLEASSVSQEIATAQAQRLQAEREIAQNEIARTGRGAELAGRRRSLAEKQAEVLGFGSGLAMPQHLREQALRASQDEVRWRMQQAEQAKAVGDEDAWYEAQSGAYDALMNLKRLANPLAQFLGEFFGGTAQMAAEIKPITASIQQAKMGPARKDFTVTLRLQDVNGGSIGEAQAGSVVEGLVSAFQSIAGSNIPINAGSGPR